MPPAVSAQTIIDRGDYLNPQFDPSTLQVAQFRGLFTYHRIPYPATGKKIDYVNVFNTYLKPRIPEFRKARENALRKEPSDDGIVDGVTGRRVGGGAAAAPPPRRSSRRPSRQPEEQEDEPPAPVTKSRRTPTAPVAESSTATRRRAAPLVQPKVEEESEPSEDDEEEPVPQPPPRRVAKKKQTTPSAPAAQSSRRKAGLSAVTEDEDGTGVESAWEHNNPFQSGPDSSSPEKLRRPSKGRSAEPAAGGTLRRRRRESDRNYNSSSPAPAPAPDRSRPSSTSKPLSRYEVEVSLPPLRHSGGQGFNPPLERVKSASDWQLEGARMKELRGSPIEVDKEDEEQGQSDLYNTEDDAHLISNHLPDTSRYTGDEELVPLNDTPQYKRMISRRSPGAYPHSDEDEDRHSDGHSEEEQEENYNTNITEKIAQLNMEGKAVVKRIRQAPVPPKPWWSPTSFRFISFLAMMWLGTAFRSYKHDSAYIGYCDAGSNTNLRVLELQATRNHRRNAADVCVNKFSLADGVNNELCNPLSVHPMNPFEPEECTTCPTRAICTPDSVICQPPFILKPHWVSKNIPGISRLLDGMPLLGSVAFPPTCVEDREKLRRIGGLVKGMENWLAVERGRKICSGVKVVPGVGGGEAKAFGLEVEALRVSATKSTNRSESDADDLFEKAIAELERYGAIVKSEDTDGTEYAAAVRADFNLACRLRVEARNLWAAYRNYVFGLLLSLLSLYEIRRRRINSSIEDIKVKQLVEEALDTLEDRELAYHADPVSTAEPYVVPVHLRDLILRDEHSPSGRQRVWEKVMKVVEGNANVRTNMEEVRGEDTKVWRWIGSTAGTPVAREKRRVSFHGKTASGSLLKD
ncbi:inner nuclear membrane protein enriched at telomere/subtelomere region [Tulasnella sp. 332]|nr:inner nuclear membrane protein enriched at telomere/subtelomere region [Tulasnella sp. 332]